MTSLRETLHRELGRYAELLPDLRSLASKLQAGVNARLSSRWREDGRPTPPVVYARVKPPDSVRQRIEERYARLEDFPDLIGCRVVVLHSHEVDKAEAAMRGWIDLGPGAEETLASWEGNATGYSGCHWSTPLATVLSTLDSNPERQETLGQFSWELQVHTAMQEAWARLSHGRFYKNRVGVPHRTSKKLKRLAAIADLIDEQFGLIEDHLKSETERVRALVEARSGHSDVEVDEFVLSLAGGTWDGQFKRLRQLARDAGFRRSEWNELVRIGDETDLCASVCERTGILTLGQFLGYLSQILDPGTRTRNTERLREILRVSEASASGPVPPQVSPLIDRPLLVFVLLRLLDFPDHIQGSHPLRSSIKAGLRAYLEEAEGSR